MDQPVKSEPSIILLHAKDKEALSQIQSAIQMQELILLSLRQSFVRVINQRYDVNLDTDSWTLDLERGILQRDPAAE